MELLAALGYDGAVPTAVGVSPGGPGRTTQPYGLRWRCWRRLPVPGSAMSFQRRSPLSWRARRLLGPRPLRVSSGTAALIWSRSATAGGVAVGDPASAPGTTRQDGEASRARGADRHVPYLRRAVRALGGTSLWSPARCATARAADHEERAASWSVTEEPGAGTGQQSRREHRAWAAHTFALNECYRAVHRYAHAQRDAGRGLASALAVVRATLAEADDLLAPAALAAVQREAAHGCRAAFLDPVRRGR
jgi:hypothetical protein